MLVKKYLAKNRIEFYENGKLISQFIDTIIFFNNKSKIAIVITYNNKLYFKSGTRDTKANGYTYRYYKDKLYYLYSFKAIANGLSNMIDNYNTLLYMRNDKPIN